MELNEITTMVSTIGFPIAMCLLFFNWFTKSYKSEQESTRQVMSELRDTVGGLKATVDALLLIIKKGDKDE